MNPDVKKAQNVCKKDMTSYFDAKRKKMNPVEPKPSGKPVNKRFQKRGRERFRGRRRGRARMKTNGHNLGDMTSYFEAKRNQAKCTTKNKKEKKKKNKNKKTGIALNENCPNDINIT